MWHLLCLLLSPPRIQQEPQALPSVQDWRRQPRSAPEPPCSTLTSRPSGSAPLHQPCHPARALSLPLVTFDRCIHNKGKFGLLTQSVAAVMASHIGVNSFLLFIIYGANYTQSVTKPLEVLPVSVTVRLLSRSPPSATAHIKTAPVTVPEHVRC